ncbi:cobyrinate a,c-diamide synthase [Halorhodospira abdelmalekii]|uniref:cobyrinate a,c-diamide synthase n=1 Tax=Halorhodospira abdelmalekii TaxID=421629 RepID=UPI001903D58A
MKREHRPSDPPQPATAAAILLSAPASGQGKSMLTAAMARMHRNLGRRVRLFKHGPDYLDPMLLEVASGAPVYQLHPWMTGVEECRHRVAAAAQQADVILIEGAMGLYDGSPSSADLAVMLGVPVAVVIDARAMAETFAAVVSGLARYRDDLSFYGAIANRVGSPSHAAKLRASMPDDLPWLGAVPRHAALTVPDRHLGLMQAGELADLEQQLDAAATVLAEAGFDALPPMRQWAAPVPLTPPPQRLAGMRVAVARDGAFAFIYRGNIELLEAMGAQVVFFSPLHDHELPAADAIWLPGGYPELHAAALAANRPMLEALRRHHQEGRAILAECGGLMYCASELRDLHGACHPMLGLLPGQAAMADRLVGLGLQAWEAEGGTLRGHTFHHSHFATELNPWMQARRCRGGVGESIYRQGSLTATYFHGYFPSAPELVSRLLGAGD